MITLRSYSIMQVIMLLMEIGLLYILNVSTPWIVGITVFNIIIVGVSNIKGRSLGMLQATIDEQLRRDIHRDLISQFRNRFEKGEHKGWPETRQHGDIVNGLYTYKGKADTEKIGEDLEDLTPKQYEKILKNIQKDIDTDTKN